MTQIEFNWFKNLEAQVKGTDFNNRGTDLSLSPSLTAWEQSFVEDILERFRQYGQKTRISPKQWETIRRLYEEKIV
ncbi:MAG TPA: hypothetical protein VLL97_06990 [Acidobacteriota bacterium]|nr:hypothetical protein [Acidobacteriota bacterium]